MYRAPSQHDSSRVPPNRIVTREVDRYSECRRNIDAVKYPSDDNPYEDQLVRIHGRNIDTGALKSIRFWLRPE